MSDHRSQGVRGKLSRQLILDELFDLTLYRALASQTVGETRVILTELIPTEERHVAFWQQFFNERYEHLNFARRVKLTVLVVAARVFGDRFVRLLLESIEVHGIQKYLCVWEQYQATQLAEALREILNDELGHEDAIVTRFHERQISGELIRNIFLGLNDGLVEMLGAVSGFFAALGNPTQVFIAGFTVAVAGAFSMAAGVYVSSGAEKEVEQTQRLKRTFLGESLGQQAHGARPLAQAFVVGIAYLLGSMVPVLPVFLGARTVLVSALAAGSVIVVVSFVLAFLSGMNVRRRIATNVVIMALAVVITYGIGTVVKVMWGI